MQKTVYFITTYKARDFEGNALIGYTLEKKYDIKVKYLTQYHFERKIIKYRPCAVIIDHLSWNHKFEFLARLRTLGIQVYLLPTEGYYQNMSYIDHVLGERFTKNPKLDGYFLWGTDMVNHLKEHPNYKVEFSKMKMTGHARFDYLMHPKLQSLAIAENLRVEFNIPQEAVVLTYMSTSSYQGYTLKEFGRRYSKNANFTAQEVEDLYNDQQKLFNNHVRIITEVAKKLGNKVFFFYKAHPAEKHLENYKSWFSGLNNIALVTHRDVKPFLHHSDYIVQRNCTTATEAWMLKKQTIQLVDDEYQDTNYEEHDKFSLLVKNADELVSVVENKAKRDYDNQELETFLIRKYGFLDGLSHERIAKEIDSWLKSVDLASIGGKTAAFEKQFSNRKEAKLKRMLFLPEDALLRPKHLWRYFKKKLGLGIKREQSETDIDEDSVNLFYNQLTDLL